MKSTFPQRRRQNTLRVVIINYDAFPYQEFPVNTMTNAKRPLGQTTRASQNNQKQSRYS